MDRHRAAIGSLPRLDRRHFLALAAATASGILLSGCQPAAAPQASPAAEKAAAPTSAAAQTAAGTTAPAKGGTTGTLHIGIPSDIQQVDPHLVSSAIDYTPMEAIAESLTTFDRDMNAVPSLAESWEQPDEKTYVFKLRQGVKYHNGREMKADDVKWSFERIIGFGGKSKWASYLADVDTVVPEDDYTVRINLKNPSAPFLSSIRYAAILPPEEEANLATKPVGTGPYRFGERVPNVHVTLTRNPDYWNKAADYIEEIEVAPVPEPQTAVANLQAGVLDLHYNLAPKFKAELDKSDTVTVYEPMPFATNYMLTLIHHAPPLDNVKLRQAIAVGVDRNVVHTAAMFGAGEPGCSPFPKGHWAHSDEIECPPYDPAKAKQLLQEAGYGNGIELTLKASPQYPEFVRTAEIFQQQLQEVGISIKIESIEWAAYVKDVYTDHNFQLGESSVVREFDPDALTSGILGTGASGNPGLYSNPKMDDLLRQGRAELDQAKRKAIYTEIVKLVIDEVPMIRQQTWPILWGGSNKVQDVFINALGRPNLLEIRLA